MDFEHTLHQKWNQIPMTAIQRLMQRHCMAVCVVNGGHAGYWNQYDPYT